MQGARYQHCDGNASTFETRQRRAGCGICTQETRDAAGSADLRWRASSPIDCLGLLEAASRLRPLDASIACRQSCGTQDRSHGAFQYGRPRVKKNDIKPHLKEYWVIPPTANAAFVHVNRAKNGEPSTHPLSGVELRALRRLKRESIESPFVFVSERGSPFTTAGYRKMIARLGEAARFSFPVHPHMLRHACGYKLANDGRDTRALQHYLGHKSIQHTVRYTKLSPDRFRDFWRD